MNFCIEAPPRHRFVVADKDSHMSSREAQRRVRVLFSCGLYEIMNVTWKKICFFYQRYLLIVQTRRTYGKINVRAEPTITNERTLWYDNDIWAGRYYMGDMAVMMWRYNVVKLGFTARLWAIEAIPAPFDLTSCLLHLRPYTKLILSNRMFFRLLTVKSHNHPFHGTIVLLQNMFLNGFAVRNVFKGVKRTLWPS